MKVSIQTASGRLLDCIVGLALQLDLEIDLQGKVNEVSPDGECTVHFCPTTRWQQGGPIAEAERISCTYDEEWVYDPAKADPDDEPDNGDRWYAHKGRQEVPCAYGATELEAKMRVIALLKLGEFAEISEKDYSLLILAV